MSELTQLVLGAYESFNRGETEPMLELMHPDIEWIPPPTSVEPRPLRGREAVREYLAPNVFETQTAEPLELIEHGNRLLVVARVRAPRPRKRNRARPDRLPHPHGRGRTGGALRAPRGPCDGAGGVAGRVASLTIGR